MKNNEEKQKNLPAQIWKRSSEFRKEGEVMKVLYCRCIIFCDVCATVLRLRRV